MSEAWPQNQAPVKAGKALLAANTSDWSFVLSRRGFTVRLCPYAPTPSAFLTRYPLKPATDAGQYSFGLLAGSNMRKRPWVLSRDHVSTWSAAHVARFWEAEGEVRDEVLG